MLPDFDLDTIMRFAVPISIFLIFIISGYVWNSQYRPKQLEKGIATDKFGGSLSRLMRFIFREDKSLIFPKLAAKQQEKFESLSTVEKAEQMKKKKFNIHKLLTYNSLYISLLLISALMVAVMPTYSWVPLIIFVMIVIARAPKVLKERHKKLVRMAIVANKTFGFGRDAERNPWEYVQVKKWLGYTTPGETVIRFSANWMMTEGGKDTFENHFTQTITNDNSWNFSWDSVKGTVTCTPVMHMPTFVSYEGSKEWDKIPIGVGIDGEVAWDINFSPHILVAGKTGSGKSVVQRNMIFHAIQHNDKWCILGIDPKRVELGVYKKYRKTVIGIATELEDEVTVLRYALEEMNNRYRIMEELSAATGKTINNIASMPDRPRNIMVMVDEAYQLMATDSSAKTDAAKEANNLHGEAADIIGQIARLGRAAGVHLVLAMQRPDAVVLKGEIKANIDARIAAGRLDSTPSSMILDSGAATRLPAIKGRGVARLGKDMEVYQGYFAEQNWIDEWLMRPENQWREPEVVEELMKHQNIPSQVLNTTDTETVEEVDFTRMDDPTDFHSHTEEPKKKPSLKTLIKKPAQKKPAPDNETLNEEEPETTKKPTPDLSFDPNLKQNPNPVRLERNPSELNKTVTHNETETTSPTVEPDINSTLNNTPEPPVEETAHNPENYSQVEPETTQPEVKFFPLNNIENTVPPVEEENDDDFVLPPTRPTL